MTPIPIIPSTYRVTLNWTSSGGVTPRNIIHVRRAAATVANIAADVNACLLPGQFLPVFSSHQLTSMDILPLDGATAGTTFPVSPVITGGGTGQPIINLSACVVFRTAQRGPRGRGRIFLGPTTEDVNIGGNQWSSGNKTTVASSWASFQNALLLRPGAPEQVVASYVHADAHVITSYTALDLLRSTKSRLNQLTG